jgi:uncharacterized repeat protein (TIGR03803 family)
MTRSQNYRMFAIALLAMILAAAISVHAQTYSVLYNFGNGDGLYNPFGVIAQGEDGSLYSTTGGGTQGYGAAFRITLTGKLTVLHSFCSETNCADGDSPTGLTLRPDGHFLGTTEGNFFLPTVYDMSQTGTVTTLASNMSAPLSSPQAPPILGADGSFYGTDKGGGQTAAQYTKSQERPRRCSRCCTTSTVLTVASHPVRWCWAQMETYTALHSLGELPMPGSFSDLCCVQGNRLCSRCLPISME